MVFACLIDLLCSPNRRGLDLKREIPEDVERYREDQIKLIFTNQTDRSAFVHWTDDFPESVQTQKLGLIELKAGQSLTIQQPDRKSTRLNSSHVAISYAVFCLKKKKDKKYKLC